MAKNTLNETFEKNTEVWKKIWEVSSDNEPRMMKFPLAEAEDGTFHLDLGCGPYCRPGSIGIDREYFEGSTDIVFDMNNGIPFPDQSVSHVFTSHFLEHVTDPLFILREVSRVCNDSAEIEIIVPLDEPAPEHVTVFDAGWFDRHKARAGLEIVEQEVYQKSGKNHAGKTHSWTEARIIMRKLAESAST